MNHRPALIVIIALIAATIVFLLTGCSKLTQENYDKISMGMNFDEVISILGEADACSGTVGVESCTWGGENTHIKINFVGKKVVLYSAKGL